MKQGQINDGKSYVVDCNELFSCNERVLDWISLLVEVKTPNAFATGMDLPRTKTCIQTEVHIRWQTTQAAPLATGNNFRNPN